MGSELMLRQRRSVALRMMRLEVAGGWAEVKGLGCVWIGRAVSIGTTDATWELRSLGVRGEKMVASAVPSGHLLRDMAVGHFSLQRGRFLRGKSLNG